MKGAFSPLFYGISDDTPRRRHTPTRALILSVPYFTGLVMIRLTPLGLGVSQFLSVPYFTGLVMIPHIASSSPQYQGSFSPLFYGISDDTFTPNYNLKKPAEAFSPLFYGISDDTRVCSGSITGSRPFSPLFYGISDDTKFPPMLRAKFLAFSPLFYGISDDTHQAGKRHPFLALFQSPILRD